MSFLARQGLIGPREEEALTGVFGLISPGSHRPIGLSEQEFARLGRSFAITMTYFLARRFNGQHRPLHQGRDAAQTVTRLNHLNNVEGRAALTEALQNRMQTILGH